MPASTGNQPKFSDSSTQNVMSLDNPNPEDVREELQIGASSKELPAPPREILEFLELIPASIAFEFCVLPVGGTRGRADEFHDICDSVRLLCSHTLSEEERRDLHFRIPSCSFEFICPGHPEYHSFSHLTTNLRQVLKSCYLPTRADRG